MPDLNEAEMSLTERIQKRLGKEAARAFDKVLSDPELSPYLHILRPDRVEDRVKSVLDLSRYLDGKLDDLRLAPALKGLFLSLHGRVPLRVIPQASVPDRPTEKEFVEALTGICDAKEEQPIKMANADFDPAAMRKTINRIVVLRGLAHAAVRFTGSVLRNLAVLEDGEVKVLRQAYGMVRPAAQADEALWVYLEVVERYLFGAAQQAAETRSKLDVVRKDAFSAGEQQALRTAERNVRDSLSDEILQLSDDLRRSTSAGAPAPDDRSRTR